MTKSNTELKPLSASRVKTYENCSWLYFCNYILKIPQKDNEGAKKGSICHTVFEMLLSKNRLKYFNEIILKDSITAVPSIKRLVEKHIKKLNVFDKVLSFQHIDKMILVGLNNDFFVKGASLISPEYEFDISNESPRFRIKGLMDKPYQSEDKIIIDDFKSAKNKFTGEDKESNLQALFYSLASSKLWPNKKPIVRFIFLQFPKNPMMEVSFTKEMLDGFEYYLEVMQEKIDNFNEKSSRKNFAADQPAGEDTFTGKALCGRATHPNQLKKDGSPMWYCPYKFGFDYYVIKNGDKIIESAFEEKNLRQLKDGEIIEKCQYKGCPRHLNVLDDIKNPPQKYTNVLDEF